MRTSLNKFRRLPLRERWLLVQSLVLLPFTALAMKVFGFRRCVNLLRRLTPQPETGVGAEPQADVSRARAHARLVGIAARHGLVRATCLSRALTLWWLLRRQGIASDLRIGVRKKEGRLEAHAWLEHHGVVLNDSPEVHEEYAAFERVIVSTGALGA